MSKASFPMHMGMLAKSNFKHLIYWKSENCKVCGGSKKVTQNAGLENEYQDDCPECVGIWETGDEVDMTGASDNGER